MKYRAPLALSVALVSVASAHADYVPPGDDRFVVFSSIDAPAPIEVTSVEAIFGTVSATVDSATYGLSSTTMVSSATSVMMVASMNVTPVGGISYLATSAAYAYYSTDGTSQLQVDWIWSSVQHGGGWTVFDAHSEEIVAQLWFDGGSYTVVGSGISQATSGAYTFNLAAGDYKFQSIYTDSSMPSSAAVTFAFVPAPGAVALLGVAGAIGGRRRRG